MTYEDSSVYWERKRAGYCVRCNRPLPEELKGKRVMCSLCEQKNINYVTAAREYRILRGLCVTCGVKKTRPGKRMCAECAEKTNEYTRKLYRMKMGKNENRSD